MHERYACTGTIICTSIYILLIYFERSFTDFCIFCIFLFFCLSASVYDI